MAHQYGAGTYVVSMAQPKMGVVRWMLGQTFYPDNEYTRDNDGNPIRPYDMATDVMAEFMGVKVDPTDVPVTASLTKVMSAEAPAGKMANGGTLSFSGHLNDSWRAANLLMAKGATVRRLDKASGVLHVGDYLVTRASRAVLATVAATTGVSFDAVTGNANAVSHVVKPLRVAMYQRYNGGNSDEGWTRLMFEQFDQPYHSIFDPELKAGNLNAKYDVLILPSDNEGTLVGRSGGAGVAEAGGRGAPPAAGRGRAGGAAATASADPNPRGGGGNAVLGGPGGGGGRGGRGGGGGGGRGGQVPEEYRSGFGDEGVSALKDFVEKGGTLVTFGESGQFAIDRFALPVRDVTAGLPYKQFWCPGCTLHVTVDTATALGYGMPANALATWLAGSQAYEIAPAGAASVQTIVRFVDHDVLQSGWLLGESVIASRPTMVSVAVGQGRVILFGFRVQHRDQTHGTYKLLFNALQR